MKEKKNFFSNYEHYDLSNGKDFESKIWSTCTCIGKVLDPTVFSHQNTSKAENIHLILKATFLRDFGSFLGLSTLGVNKG